MIARCQSRMRVNAIVNAPHFVSLLQLQQTKMFYFVCFIFATFSTSLANVELLVVGDNNAVCSGASVTLQCTLMGNVLTWNTPEGALNFVRGRQDESNAGSYHARLMEPNATHLISRLSFTFTSEITINCSDNTASTSTTVTTEGPPSAPDRPLTALDRIRRLNKTVSSVSVVWNIPDTNNAHISSYVVTVDPPIPLPAGGVIAADNPLFQYRQLALNLLHSVQYYITVRARSCSDSVDGPTSSALTIKVQVPQTVARCTALPVYDYYSNNLIRIEIGWDPIPDIGEDITASITASVQSYIISAVPIGIPAPTINVTLGATDHSVCGSTKCTHNFQSTSEMSALHYSVYVTAKNLLSDGYSERQMCSNLTISPANDLLSVDVRKNFTDVVEVLCRPLTRFQDTAHCEVVYRILPEAMSYTETSEGVGGARDIVSVLLSTAASSEVNISVAARTRGGKQDVVVEGTFETGDIVSSKENLMRHLCPENDTTDSTQGPTIDSTAVDASESCPSTPWILAPGVFIIALPAGIIIGMIAMFACCSKRKRSDLRDGHASYYEYISPKDISLESNKCYTTSIAPELPKPRKM